ncbi:MAG TPA: transposase [Nevskiaceae bacterium]|nr:transposase [Nevskiaceae bacterium]
MARLPRLVVPHHPHHVIQRGNNRQAIFLDDDDRLQLLELLGAHARRDKVALHGYVLMDNHFHLLATPATQSGLSAMMQGVGRRYVRYFNQRYQRTGTLWEGRYRATPVQTERYLLACMAYIDLNPVRAGMVARAADYRWSSYGHYAGLRSDPLITTHPLYWQLGNTPFAREAGYVELVGQGVAAQTQALLTDTALKGWVLGDVDFVAGLQKQTPRRMTRARAGRPFSKTKAVK